MKSSLAIVSLLAVVFIAGRLSHQLSAKAATFGAGTTDAPVCGDLNDDSSADISDASYGIGRVIVWEATWRPRRVRPDSKRFASTRNSRASCIAGA